MARNGITERGFKRLISSEEEVTVGNGNAGDPWLASNVFLFLCEVVQRWGSWFSALIAQAV
jgi:hypothetical protein